MIYYVTYDPAASYPQQPRAGLGVIKPDGTHIPPSGLASFEVDGNELIHGARNEDVERFYEVVSGPALRAFNAAEVEAVVAPDRRNKLIAVAYDEAARRSRAALGSMYPEVANNPQIRDDAARSRIDRILAINAGRIRREANGRGKPGERDKLDAGEQLADSNEAIETALDAVIVKINDDTYTESAQVTGASEWP